MELISITHLSPDTPPPSHQSIRAVVTLIWPYSTSSKQCALLLAEPDFRLRYRKGQVRALFTGPSAEAIAKLQVNIGDELVLGLKGAIWRAESGHIRTPGKSVEGELLFDRCLDLRLVGSRHKDGAAVSIDVRTQTSSSWSASPPAVFTPDQTGRNGIHPRMDTGGSRMMYDSPAFTKRLRLSGENLWDNAYDPFEEDEARPRKMQRTSFGRVQLWRYEARSPSPESVASNGAVSPTDDVDDVDVKVPAVAPRIQERASRPGVDETIENTDLDAVLTNSAMVEPSDPSSESPKSEEDTPELWEAQGIGDEIPAMVEAMVDAGSEAIAVPIMDPIHELSHSTPSMPSPEPKTQDMDAHLQRAEGVLMVKDDIALSENGTFMAFDELPSSAHPLLDQDVSTVPDVHDCTYTAPADVEVDVVRPDQVITGLFTSHQLQPEIPESDQHPSSDQDAFMSEVLALDSDSDEASQRKEASPPERFDHADDEHQEDVGAICVTSPSRTAESPSHSVPNSEFQSLEQPDQSESPDREAPGFDHTGLEHGTVKVTTDDILSTSKLDDPPQDFLVEADEALPSTVATHVSEDIDSAPRTPPRSRQKSSLSTPQTGSAAQDASYVSGGTPDSVREKVMVHTLSSLFGFTGTESTSNSPLFSTTQGAREGTANHSPTNSVKLESAQTAQDVSDWGLGPPSFEPPRGLFIRRNKASQIEDESLHEDEDETNRTRMQPPMFTTIPAAEVGPSDIKEEADHEMLAEPASAYPWEPTESHCDLAHSLEAAHAESASDHVFIDYLDRDDVIPTNAMSGGNLESSMQIYAHEQSSRLESGPQSAPRDEQHTRSTQSNLDGAAQAREDVEMDMLSQTYFHGDGAVVSVDEKSSQSADVSPQTAVEVYRPSSRQSSIQEEAAYVVDRRQYADAESHIDIEFETEVASVTALDDDLTSAAAAKIGYTYEEDIVSSDADVVVEIPPIPADERITSYAVSNYERCLEKYREDPEIDLQSRQAAVVESNTDSADVNITRPDDLLALENSTTSARESMDAVVDKDSMSEHEDEASDMYLQGAENQFVRHELSEVGFFAPLPDAEGDSQVEDQSESATHLELETIAPLDSYSTSAMPMSPIIPVIDETPPDEDILPSVEVVVPETASAFEVQSMRPQVSPGTAETEVQAVEDEQPGLTKELATSPTNEANTLVRSPTLLTPHELDLLDSGLPIASRTRSRLSILEVDMIEYPERKSPRKPSDEELIDAQLQTELQDEAAVGQTEHAHLPHAPISNTRSGPGLAKTSSADGVSEGAAMKSLPEPFDGGSVIRPAEASKGPTDDRSPTFATPARKAFTGRISLIPSAISAWFSPKRLPETRDMNVPAVTPSKRAVESKHKDTAFDVLSQGLSTPLAYFSPLVYLDRALNKPSNETFDILAAVVENAEPPARAKDGPRDFYTVFRIADGSRPALATTRVEVFRPWKAKLPQAAAGDVVLLRGFTVKSRSHQAYLLSTDASSYCVWRYSTDEQALDDIGEASSAVLEEMKGPPVELGDEERQRARLLRQWWVQAYGDRESAA